MDRLKDLLDRDEVEYNEKFFDTSDGITGLKDEPFVSIFHRNMYGRDVV